MLCTDDVQATGYGENIEHTPVPADINGGQQPSTEMESCDFHTDSETARTLNEQPLLDCNEVTWPLNKCDSLLTGSNSAVAAADTLVQQSQRSISRTDCDAGNGSMDLISSDDDSDCIMAAMAAEQEQLSEEQASDCDSESGDNDVADDCICIIKSEGVDEFVDCVADMKQFTLPVSDTKPGA